MDKPFNADLCTSSASGIGGSCFLYSLALFQYLLHLLVSKHPNFFEQISLNVDIKKINPTLPTLPLGQRSRVRGDAIFKSLMQIWLLIPLPAVGLRLCLVLFFCSSFF